MSVACCRLSVFYLTSLVRHLYVISLSLSLSLSLDLPLVKLTTGQPCCCMLTVPASPGVTGCAWRSRASGPSHRLCSALQTRLLAVFFIILVVILCVFLGTSIRRFDDQHGSISWPVNDAFVPIRWLTYRWCRKNGNMGGEVCVISCFMCVIINRVSD